MGLFQLQSLGFHVRQLQSEVDSDGCCKDGLFQERDDCTSAAMDAC